MIHENSDQFEQMVLEMKPRARRVLQALQIRPPLLAAVRRYLIPSNRADAIEGLLYTLPPAMLAELKVMDRKDLIRLHHTLGQDIRNLFQLWGGNSALVKDCGGHPDDTSHSILEGLWDRLQADDSPDSSPG